ncbi:[acyl-carrier-protein] S-malonyltransferase [Hydrogenispora ethanolica]|uniref:Malonyl CoA-acyl carrier protein transacylase n=1 Tax=Hydrogenispora ethanolica TaxID=1082276 RepID=A0A4R1QZ92_HYDET|nr:ACP S-malonyltransferase [Hydrogenispora ethanolica]TCL58299.1 [acyl-carrier-protein] S-malonyltransferase [Hydrogenispora ethanolica]
MTNIAFLFPGQGSQYVGMGKEFYENFPQAKAVFDEADQVLGRKISELCFAGPEEALKDTRNAQPAIFTVSIAAWKVLTAEGIRADYVAGHSLGEYSALVASGALTFAEALCLLNRRAQFMAGADPDHKGTMAAVLGIDRASLMPLLSEAASFGRVEAANYNCPGQIVISGEKTGIAKAQEAIAAQGGRMIPLAVSGPFHSSLMRPAAEAFRPELEACHWKDPAIPLIANVSARPVLAFDMADSLYRQIFSAVLWEDTLRFLAEKAITTYIEIGPGKVLTGLTKKTLKDVTLLGCEDPGSLKKALAILKEV